MRDQKRPVRKVFGMMSLRFSEDFQERNGREEHCPVPDPMVLFSSDSFRHVFVFLYCLEDFMR